MAVDAKIACIGWLETLESGRNLLVGTDVKRIVNAVVRSSRTPRQHLEAPCDLQSAASRIVAIILTRAPRLRGSPPRRQPAPTTGD